MFTPKSTFSSFSTHNLSASKKFYENVLGMTVSQDSTMPILHLHLGDGEAIIYAKDDHVPAAFTVLNFVVENIDDAVDELKSRGVAFEQFEEDGFSTDEKSILRGLAANQGPDIAWFKDPAGNTLSVLQDK